MKIILITLFTVHGSLHLFGFFAGFGIVRISQLPFPISPNLGLLWLFVALAIFLAVVLVWNESKYWFLLTGVAACVSQVLITCYGGAVGYVIMGTIVNLLLLLVTALGFFTWHFEHIFWRDVARALAPLPPPAHEREDRLHENDLLALPEPVRQYLRFVGALGQPKPQSFSVELKGELRSAADQPWMPFDSVQYNVLNPPTRLFFLRAEMKSLPVAGYHKYIAGVAKMDIRLLSRFRVQYMDGPEMNVGETVTFLNDMCCLAPVTLIDPRIRWLAVEEDRVQLSFTHAAITVTAWLHFNAAHQLVDFVSEDRAAAQPDGSLLRVPWSTPLRDYKDIHGYMLPSKAETIYHYPAGAFTYGKFEVMRVSFDPA